MQETSDSGAVDGTRNVAHVGEPRIGIAPSSVAEELHFRHRDSATFTPAQALPLVEPWAECDKAIVHARALVVVEAAEERWRVLVHPGV